MILLRELDEGLRQNFVRSNRLRVVAREHRAAGSRKFRAARFKDRDRKRYYIDVFKGISLAAVAT